MICMSYENRSRRLKEKGKEAIFESSPSDEEVIEDVPAAGTDSGVL